MNALAPSDADTAMERRVAQALTWRYAVALLLVALLSTAAWFSLGLVIETQASSSAVVNISGRQRMLSQRTALFAAQLARTPAKDVPAAEQRLADAMAAMARAHRGLTEGDATLGLPKRRSAAVQHLYFDAPVRLDQQVQAHLQKLDAWLQTPPALRRPDHPLLTDIVHAATGPLLKDLDGMVLQYQKEGEAAVTQLHRVETVLWLGTLGLLLLEALLIFHPFVRHVKAVLDRLARSRQALQAERDRLEQTVSERTAALQTQVNNLQVHQTTLAQVPQGVLFCAADKTVVYANAGFEQTTGYPLADVIGKDIALLEGPETAPDTATAIREAMDGRQDYRGTVLHYRRDGHPFWDDLSIRPVQGSNGLLLGYTAVLNDVSEFKYRETSYWTQAHHDPLTGLPNRLLLAERWHQAVLRCVRYRSHGALLFLDLNRFKAVNDQLGHEYGDQVLVQVGVRLNALVRDVDTVARLGGDEFVVLLTDLHTDPILAQQQAEAVALKLQQAIGAPYLLNKPHAPDAPTTAWSDLGASVGMALFSHLDSELDPVIQAADQSMYRKKQRRGTVAPGDNETPPTTL